jgi:hypothetical protein
MHVMSQLPCSDAVMMSITVDDEALKIKKIKKNQKPVVDK